MRMLNESSDEGVSPATRLARGELRREYQQLLAGLERYDRMQGFVTPAEFGASTLGQLGRIAFNGVLGTGLGHMARYGREIHVGRRMRIAPFGNRTGHPIGRWPHYHRPRPDPSRPRDSLPFQGTGRHRPWESYREDQSFFDRF
jgi:hypothetical protein